MRKALLSTGIAAGIALMIALTALGVVAADRALSARMAEVKSQTMAALEAMIGRSITYGDISPSFFRALLVRDLVILDTPGSSKPLLSIRQIRVSYSLFRLLETGDAVSSIREIQFLNTGISLDVDRDKDVLDLLGRLARPQGQGAAGEFHAKITGANMSVALRSSKGSVKVENLFFEIQSAADAIAVSMRGTASGTMPNGFTFLSPLRAEGSFDSGLQSTDMTVRLLSFQSSLLNAQAQTLHVAWKGNALDIRKIRDRSPVALELQADVVSGLYTLTFQAERLRPDRLVMLSSRFSRYAGWMKVPLTASGHVTYDVPHGTLDYRADVAAFLEDQLPVHDVSLDASFRGTEKEAFFEPLRLASTNGSLVFEGSILFATFYPSGLLTLADIRSGTSEPLSATLSIERMQGSLDVKSTHLAFGKVGFDSFHLTMSPLPDGASFKALASFEGTSGEDTLDASGALTFSVPLGKAASEGGLRNVGAPQLTLSMGLKDIPPDRLYHLWMGAGDLSSEQADIARFLGGFTVSADVTLATDFSSVSVDSAGVSVAQPGEPGTSMRFGLSADSRHISVKDFQGTWKGLQVAGGFEGTLPGNGQVGFNANLVYLGNSYAFTGSFTPESGLSATGSYGLAISAVPLHNGTTSIRVKADHFPLPLRQGPLLVSFDAGGLVAMDGQWSADILSLTIYDLPFLQSRTNTIQASGKLTPTRLDLSLVRFSDAFSTLSGSAVADFVLPDNPFDQPLLDSLKVSGAVALAGAGGESYSVKGGFQQGSLSLSYQLVGLPLARVLSTAITGSLDGIGTIGGTLAGPQLTAAVALKGGRLGTDPLSVAGELTLRGSALEARSVSIAYLSHRLTDGSGSISLQDGTMSLRGRYAGVYFADALSMAIAVDGTFPAGETASLPDFFRDGVQGKINLTGITVADTPFPPWNLNVHSANGRLAIDGGPSGSVTGWIDPSSTFQLGLATPLPLNGTIRGSLSGGQIDAVADVESVEMVVLNSMLKSGSVSTPAGTFPIYKVTAGVATGSVSVKGPVNDPDFSGELDLIGGGLQSAYSPDEAGPIRAMLTFAGKTLHAARTVAAVGAARMDAEATFTLDHWTPVNFDISLATDGQVPAHVRGRFGRLIAEGAAAGQLRIAGDDRSVSITGNLVISDCRIALGDMPPGTFVPEDTPTIVSLTTQVGRRVEFYWPSLDLPVLRTTAVPGGSIAITYRGDTGAYTVKGTAGVQGGEIYYFDRSFIVKKGSIALDENQAKFDPWITATAEVREWDPDTAEEVKITLSADSPFSRFSPRFSSDPSRTDAQILAMIGVPIANQAEAQGIGLPAFVYTDILSQTWILRPFEQKVRQVLNLDMFSIRTQILQNLVAQKLFGTTANPLDNTSVSLGKYLGDDLFLEMVVQLQQQPQLVGSLDVPGRGL